MRLHRERRRAGQSAERRFEELRREWIGRNRLLFRVVNGLVVILVVASFASSRIWPAAAWVVGLFAGMAMAAAVIMRQSPPGWIENWRTGASGEQRTATGLSDLDPAAWTVRHDLSTVGGANIDHVVVGPAGVFALETKTTIGTITRTGETLAVTRSGADRPAYTFNPAGQARGNAAKIHDEILKFNGRAPWVRAVVVLWGEFTEPPVNYNKVTYLHGDDLVSWLTSLPVELSAGQVHDASTALDRSFESVTTPIPHKVRDISGTAGKRGAEAA